MEPQNGETRHAGEPQKACGNQRRPAVVYVGAAAGKDEWLEEETNVFRVVLAYFTVLYSSALGKTDASTVRTDERGHRDAWWIRSTVRPREAGHSALWGALFSRDFHTDSAV